jgi:hypothetical protein
MNLLLTGAAGFTGLFFKSAAEAAGHTVWPLTADLTDKAAVAQLFQLADSDLNRNHVGFSF